MIAYSIEGFQKTGPINHTMLNLNNHRMNVDYQPLMNKFKDITASFGINDDNRDSNSRVKKYRVRIVEPPTEEHPSTQPILENRDSLFGKQRKILKFSSKNLNARELIKNHKQFKTGFQGSKIKNHSYSPNKIRPATRFEPKELDKSNEGKGLSKISKAGVEKDRPGTNVITKKKLATCLKNNKYLDEQFNIDSLEETKVNTVKI